MDLWDRFKALHPMWDKFKLLPLFKNAMRQFLPVAESLAPEPDLKDPLVAYINDIINTLREGYRKDNRANDGVLRPIQKMSLGLISSDPAYRNYAVAIIGMIRAKNPELTNKQKAWIKSRFGVDVP